MPPRRTLLLPLLLVGASALVRADDTDKKYPLDPPLKVLARDLTDEKYRELVLKKMLSTDLAAEWQRVATADNPDSFLEKHGGKDKVLADPGLKAAYERRVKIRDDFLDLMRQGYKRHNMAAPFDKGATVEKDRVVRGTLTAPAVPLSVVPPCDGAAGQWPCFRGPSAQGYTDAKDLPTKWDKDGTNVRWRVKIPGAGNSSPVVWGDHVFLTSAQDKGAERFVHCVSLAKGELLWSKQAPAKAVERGVRDKNGYASSTPVTDGERVISFLGSSGLVCHDFSGKPLWHYDRFAVGSTHGTAASPVLYKDLVILAQDQNQAPSVFVALNKKTGEVVWEGKRPKAMTWNTPVIVRAGDRDEMIVVGGETVRGYDPATGKELWVLNGPTLEVVPAVVVGKDLVYSASGRNGPTIAFRPDGRGDVTETHTAWKMLRGGPHVPSPVLAGDRLVTVNDFGVLTCVDATTGGLVYQERLGDRFSASPVLVGDLIYAPGESGATYVLRAGDAFELVAKNDLGSPILASPAVVKGRLLLRTEDELICIGAR